MHLILIPTYNERENIGTLLDAVCAHEDVHVLVIDDASPDGTADEVRSHAYFGDRVFLLARAGKDGLGAAYRAGFAWGLERSYATLTQMDADFSHDPTDIPRLLAEVSLGADVVIGSRKIPGGRIEGWNAWRIFCSAGAMIASRLCLGLKTRDVTAGFRTWRTGFVSTLPVLSLKSSGYSFQEEMILIAEMARGNVREIPVVFRDRVLGVSKVGMSDIVEFFYTLARLTLRRRERFVRFALIGALGAVIDFGLFSLFYYIFGFSLIVANVFSIGIAMLHNFLWHHLVTFRHHGRGVTRAFGIFVSVSLVGMLFNTLLVLAGVSFGLPAFFAKAFAISAVMIWNYFLNSRVTFRK